MLAKTPHPPYYAVIFTSLRSSEDEAGYGVTSDEMVALAADQAGFLGIESAREAQGLGITVSYWSSLDAISAWRAHAEHRVAQRLGRERWYRAYELRVAKVERAYGFDGSTEADGPK